MQPKLSFTKSLIYLNVSKAPSALPSVSSLDTVLGLSMKFPLWALPVLCVCVHFLSCHYRCLFECPWDYREQASREGMWRMCTHTHAQLTGHMNSIPPAHPLLLGLIPSIFLREFWKPSRIFFLVPQPKRKSLIF